MSNLNANPSSDPRVRFAAERTLLAWIRTGLALMGFGFVVARFSWLMREFAGHQQSTGTGTGGWSLWIGVSLICLGIVVNLAAAKEHLRIIRLLDRGEHYSPPAWSLGILVAILIAILGLGTTSYLVTLAAS